jgi:FkbM family methyltransferase
MYNFETPILFLIFNRPDLTKVSFEQIAQVKPKKLYIAADGPRIDVKNERETCQKTLNQVLQRVDWECEVFQKINPVNLGCGKAVSSAINWFFEQEEEGIILEDDCLPDPSFFDYCATMLERYRHDDQVFSISGNNLVHNFHIAHDYLFSKYTHVWGWATWKRSWELYDFSLSLWNRKETQFKIKQWLSQEEFNYWYGLFDQSMNFQIDTWDYQLLFSSFIHEKLNVHPKKNLVRNIGFGQNATHTKDANSRFSQLKTSSFKETKRTSKIELDKAYDKMVFEYVFLSESPKLTLRDKFYSYRHGGFQLHLKKILLALYNSKDLFFIKRDIQKKNGIGQRFLEGKKELLGTKFTYPDQASFDFIYNEVFNKQIYKFISLKPNPVIIDCGANIGLSVLYFKQLYPDSQITAFEPDPNIFAILQSNLLQFDFKNIRLIQHALWDEETEIQFYHDGSDGGRIETTNTPGNLLTQVKTDKLSKYIDKEVDFLKIDIEGAELKVINEIENKLHLIKHLFIEYHSFEQENQNLDLILQILKKNGFRYYIENAMTLYKQPFIFQKSSLGMDNQINIFALKL